MSPCIRPQRFPPLLSFAFTCLLGVTGCQRGELFGDFDSGGEGGAVPRNESSSDLNTGGGGNFGGMGGGTSDPLFIDPPAQVLTAGRLSDSPSACWVHAQGSLSDESWRQKQALYQTIIAQWTEGSPVDIQWTNACSDPDESGNYAEDIRILLDDRENIEAMALIENCDLRQDGRTWAASPDKRQDFTQCRWNMSLSVHLKRQSSVLHAAGHAFGVVHHHFGWTGQCPLTRPAAYSWSPYLSQVDTNSAMLFGMVEYGAANAVDSPCADPAQWEDASLSSGDRFTFEMLYPTTTEHSTWNTESGLLYQGRWIFPTDNPIGLTNDWIHRGASRKWFIKPEWHIVDPNTDFGLSSPGVQVTYTTKGNLVFPPIDHSFYDPFGISHTGATTVVEISSTKHAAVLTSIF